MWRYLESSLSSLVWSILMDRKSQCSWVKNFRLAHPYGGLLGCAFYRGCREPFASAPSTTRSAKKSTPRNVNIKGDGRRWSGRDKERRTDGGSVVSLWYSETVSSLEVWTTMNLHFNTKVSYWYCSTSTSAICEMLVLATQITQCT